jgi:hypothetical protein
VPGAKGWVTSIHRTELLTIRDLGHPYSTDVFDGRIRLHSLGNSSGSAELTRARLAKLPSMSAAVSASHGAYAAYTDLAFSYHNDTTTPCLSLSVPVPLREL